jgi:hypothetical protein
MVIKECLSPKKQAKKPNFASFSSNFAVFNLNILKKSEDELLGDQPPIPHSLFSLLFSFVILLEL